MKIRTAKTLVSVALLSFGLSTYAVRGTHDPGVNARQKSRLLTAFARHPTE